MIAALRALRPDLVVLVDSSGFNLPFARRARRLGCPTLYYVSPQVWAWRTRPDPQARALGEPARGDLPVRARRCTRARACPWSTWDIRSWSGCARDASVDRERARRELGLPANARIVALLPGSRAQRDAPPAAAPARGRARAARARSAHPLRRCRARRRSRARRSRPGSAPRGCRRCSRSTCSTATRSARCARPTSRCCKPGTSTLEAALLDCPLVVAARTQPAHRLAAAPARARRHADDAEPDRGRADRARVPPGGGAARGDRRRGARAARRARARRAARAARRSCGRRSRRAAPRVRAAEIAAEMLGVGVFRHSAAALAAALAAPVAAGALALRPRWRAGWRERLGAGPVAAGAIWVHAASVGEVTASARLVERLRAQRPRAHALDHERDRPRAAARSCTRTSRTGSRRSITRGASTRCCAARARARSCSSRPSCGRSGSPRASAAACPWWSSRAGSPTARCRATAGSVRWLARALARLAAIGARTEQDAERFVALGAAPERVRVTGDLKLDPPETPRALAPDLAAWLGDAPLVVAGSTHPGEEEALLAAQRAWERGGAARRAGRSRRATRSARGEVVALARRAGRRAALRSERGGAPLAAGDVGVLDTLGELPALYARAAVAFVGGTLAPVGGHNLLEPAAAGTPAVYGAAHSRTCDTPRRCSRRCGAGERVADAAALARGALRGARARRPPRARAARRAGPRSRRTAAAASARPRSCSSVIGARAPRSADVRAALARGARRIARAPARARAARRRELALRGRRVAAPRARAERGLTRPRRLRRARRLGGQSRGRRHRARRRSRPGSPRSCAGAGARWRSRAAATGARAASRSRWCPTAGSCAATAASAGDEPVLLAAQAPGVPVLVGRDRGLVGPARALGVRRRGDRARRRLPAPPAARATSTCVSLRRAPRARQSARAAARTAARAARRARARGRDRRRGRTAARARRARARVARAARVPLRDAARAQRAAPARGRRSAAARRARGRARSACSPASRGPTRCAARSRSSARRSSPSGCSAITTASRRAISRASPTQAPRWITTEKDAVKLVPAWAGRARDRRARDRARGRRRRTRCSTGSRRGCAASASRAERSARSSDRQLTAMARDARGGRSRGRCASSARRSARSPAQ